MEATENYTACDHSLLTIWLSVQIPHKVIYLYHTILCQRICKLTIFIHKFESLRINHHSPSMFYYEKKVTIMNKDKIQRRKWYWYAQFCKNENIVHVSWFCAKICIYNNRIKYTISFKCIKMYIYFRNTTKGCHLSTII